MKRPTQAVGSRGLGGFAHVGASCQSRFSIADPTRTLIMCDRRTIFDRDSTDYEDWRDESHSLCANIFQTFSKDVGA
jgi:hypothetical protein